MKLLLALKEWHEWMFLLDMSFILHSSKGDEICLKKPIPLKVKRTFHVDFNTKRLMFTPFLMKSYQIVPKPSGTYPRLMLGTFIIRKWNNVVEHLYIIYFKHTHVKISIFLFSFFLFIWPVFNKHEQIMHFINHILHTSAIQWI